MVEVHDLHRGGSLRSAELDVLPLEDPRKNLADVDRDALLRPPASLRARRSPEVLLVFVC